nr:uncharacterized protein LOC112732874 [Arachis hypogaea]
MYVMVVGDYVVGTRNISMVKVLENEFKKEYPTTKPHENAPTYFHNFLSPSDLNDNDDVLPIYIGDDKTDEDIFKPDKNSVPLLRIQHQFQFIKEPPLIIISIFHIIHFLIHPISK